MQVTDIVKRRCLDTLMDLADDPRMKFILGITYSGKTVLLRQIQGALLVKGVPDNRIAKVSFDKGTNLVDSPEAFLHLIEQSCPFDTGYLLIDSIHMVPDFAYTMNLFRLRHPNVSVFMTLCQNTTQPAVDTLNFIPKEDYVVVHLYPFTFREYLELNNTPPDSALVDFVSNGGSPFLRRDMSFDLKAMLMDGYAQLLINRMVLRENKCNAQGMVSLLNYMISSIGTSVTQKDLVAKSGIADNRTLEKYIQRTLDSGVIFSLKGYQLDRAMKESTKFTFFSADTLNGGFMDRELYRTLSVAQVLQSMVHIELLVRGYETVALLSKGEFIGFGVEKEGKMHLLRVTSHMKLDSATPEFTQFRSSTLPKLYLTLDRGVPEDPKLCHRNLVDFLLADDF